MLDVRRLRVLHAVASYGSVTAAAHALGYSGPAVSQQLAALEREVGMSLTERRGRGISLTPAADILVGHTDALLGQLEAAEAEVAGLREQIVGRVSIAAFPSAAAALLPDVWATLTRDAPHVEPHLVEMEPEESLPAVLRGEVDVAVAHEYDLLPRPLDPAFERRDLLADPVLIALHREHPAARSTTLDLRSLRDDAFLAPRAHTSCAEMTQRACARAGFVPTVAARATDFHVLLSLAAARAGVLLVPRLAARNIPDQVRLVAPKRSITRQVFTVSRRGGDRTPAVRVVLDELTAAAGRADDVSGSSRTAGSRACPG